MTRWILPLLLVLMAQLVPARAAESPAPQWIVVTAPAFRSALEPLCKQRKADGMQVVVVQSTDILTEKEILDGETAKLKEHVCKLSRDYKGTSYVLLVGAVEAGKLDEPVKKVLPPLKGTVSRMKGQPSDNGYGCTGDDLLPTVAVGRFPARTEEEARQMVEKTIAYERNGSKPGEWKRRLTVLAGVPEFNPVVDGLVESMAMSRLNTIDPSWTGHAIYHNRSSRFYIPDEYLQKQAKEYVEAGQAVTLYLGHSSPEGFWAGPTRYLNRNDWANLKIKEGPGIFATFGCQGCQLTGKDGEGYGVAAMRNPNGPAAVIGSHGICFAAMVKIAAEGFVDSSFTRQKPERLGQSWLETKRRLAKGKIDPLTFTLLDRIDGDNEIPQATQRQEHQEMLLLLGDPALRLPVVKTDVKVQVTGTPDQSTQPIIVKGQLPARLAGAKVFLTMERPVASEAAAPRFRTDAIGGRGDCVQWWAASESDVQLEAHRLANQFLLRDTIATVEGTQFEGRLWGGTRAKVIIRAYAATDKEDGLGILELDLPQPK